MPGCQALSGHRQAGAADSTRPSVGYRVTSSRPTHRQLEGTSVKTRSRNSPVWPGSKVVGMMT